MTNADKIRSMTDEGLLEFFRPNVIACQDCPAYAYCDQNYNPYTDLTVKCSDVIFAWLKQEVEE